MCKLMSVQVKVVCKCSEGEVKMSVTGRGSV